MHALFDSIEASAEIRGAELGISAAIGFATIEAAERLAEGISDGDPEILDSLPSCSATAGEILAEILDSDELSTELSTDELDALVSAFHQAFGEAVADKVERDSREILRSAELDEIESRSAYRLASDASCVGPDNLDSAGAEFLTDIRDRLVELVRNGEWDEDSAHSIADESIPIYTWPKWRAFVDLGAWQEEPELGDSSPDLDELGSLALFAIAERLVGNLADELGLDL